MNGKINQRRCCRLQTLNRAPGMTLQQAAATVTALLLLLRGACLTGGVRCAMTKKNGRRWCSTSDAAVRTGQKEVHQAAAVHVQLQLLLLLQATVGVTAAAAKVVETAVTAQLAAVKEKIF